MRKMNGFTLIELLAVIVILAIIAVIVTPLAINVINDSRERSLINSTYGLIDGVRLLSAEQQFIGEMSEVVVNFNDGVADNPNFKVSGDMPNSGTIYLNSEGKVELKAWSETLGKCVETSVDKLEVKLTETKKEECKISDCSIKALRKNLKSDELICLDPDKNVRYVGSSPNNYIWFNKDENGNPEKWRIIGVFHDETKGDQIKIIRNEYYSTSIKWDINNSNNWTTSSLNALWNDKENETSYIRSIQTNDPTSFRYIDLEHEWNIGGTPNYNSSTRLDFYNAERSETKSSTMDSHLWIGAIGLIYPSDFGYSTNGDITTCDSLAMYNWSDVASKTECAEKSWLYDSSYYQWTLTPRTDHSYTVFRVHNAGRISTPIVSNDLAARPVVYLESNVKIVGGKGTYDEPFVLGIE